MLRFLKKKRLSRLKRFLFNAEAKYSYRELGLNWVIFTSIIMMILFGSLFAIYAKDVQIKSFSNIGIKIPQPANSFSVVSFISLIILIATLILKLLIKRKKKGHLNEKYD